MMTKSVLQDNHVPNNAQWTESPDFAVPLTDSGALLVPCSPGDVLDRLSILRLKAQAAHTNDQRARIGLESELLRRIWLQEIGDEPEASVEWSELASVNETLWSLEDRVRECERIERFDLEFTSCARAIYRNNDVRAAIKRRVSERLGSPLREYKFHGGAR